MAISRRSLKPLVALPIVLSSFSCAFVYAQEGEKDFTPGSPLAPSLPAGGMSTGTRTASGVRISVELDATQRDLVVGDTFAVQAVIRQSGGSGPIEFRQVDIPGIDAFGKDAMIEQKRETSYQFDGTTSVYRIVFSVSFRATEAGTYELGPVKVGSGAMFATSRPLTVTVRENIAASGLAGSSGSTGTASGGVADTAFPMVGAPAADESFLSDPGQRNTLAVIVAILLALAAIFASLVIMLLRSYRQSREYGRDTPSDIGTDSAEMAEIRNEGEFSDALAAYYGRDIRTLTSREILALETDQERRTILADILHDLERARYAGGEPDEALVERMTRFVRTITISSSGDQ